MTTLQNSDPTAKNERERSIQATAYGSGWRAGCAAMDLLKKHVDWLKETSPNQLFDVWAIGKMIEEAESRGRL
jgi:hypothetical protein